MKKRILALLLALVMVFSMAACSKTEEAKEEEQTVDLSSYVLSDSETIEIEFWHNYSNAKRAAWLEEKANEFMADHPNVKINIVVTGGHPATREAVAGALAAGTGLCAISTVNAPQVQVYAQSAVAEPLDNYFAANEVDVNDFYEGMIDAGTYDEDGLIYGIPFGISTPVCYYNETDTKAAGAEVPETWDEFKVWCKTVSEYTGHPAFGFAYSFNTLNTFMLSVTGVDPLGDGKVSQLNNAAIKEFLMEVRELVQNGYALYMGAKVDSASNDMLAAFKSNEISGYIDSSSGCVKAAQCGIDSNFDVAYRICVGNDGREAVSTVSGAYLVVYAQQATQAQKNAAAAFAFYLTNEENNSSFSNDTIMFPSRKASKVEGILAQYPEMEGVFSHADQIISKNKVSCMQEAMQAVAGVFGDVVKGDVAEEDIDATWDTLTKEIDAMLADAQ